MCFEDLYRIFAKYLWSFKEEGREKHWVSWSNICLPKEESGLGFKSLFDVSEALFARLWWNFKTKKSLQENFLWNKYYKKFKPQMVEWSEGSQVWKNILLARDCIDQKLQRGLRYGNFSLNFDNWIHIYLLVNHYCNNNVFKDISQLMNQGYWNNEVIMELLNKKVCNHVHQRIGVEREIGEWDKPWWMPNSTGKFSVGTAWKLLRQRRDPQKLILKFWEKGISFKVSFIMWRLQKLRIYISEVLVKIKVVDNITYYYCNMIFRKPLTTYSLSILTLTVYGACLQEL